MMSLGSIKMSFLWKGNGFPLAEFQDESSMFTRKVEISSEMEILK